MDLNKIKDPSFLKELDIRQLNQLASDIREFLINNISKTGGHLSSNLGVVELTIALHYVFNSPKDKIFFDVGHQSYVHKILTGRASQFNTLRKYQGLSGFQKRCESEHDVWEAGHSSTALSGAVAMAIARDLDKQNFNVIPVVGDAAMVGGESLEALNHLGSINNKVIIILNDNQMAIGKSVGGFNDFLSSIRLSGTYNSIRMAAEELQEEYPERKLIVIDSLCACMGEGLLVYKAVQLKRAGKSLEEVAAWVEENKLHIMHNVTIDDLFHLHRGGRVSKASAIVGTMIQIKPIIHMDDHGELKVIGKESGRKKALTHIVDMAVKQSEGWDNDIVMITHGDCKEDAEFVARQVEKKMGVHNILINCIGTVIGSHTGPGVVAVFCMGNKR